MTQINLKKVKTMLMKKDLCEFIKEMWDAYETSPFCYSWLIDFTAECFMYSLKHFLPKYIWEDWISDEEFERIKKDVNGKCPVRDKMVGGTHTHNHDWNVCPRHTKSTIMNVLGPVWAVTNSPISLASVSHTSTLSTDMTMKKQKLLNSEKYKYYFGEDPNLKLTTNSATKLQLKSGAQLYSVCQTSFTGFGADCFAKNTKVLTKNSYKNIEDIKVGDEVLSYNHKTGKIEPKVVQAVREIEKNEFIEIETSSGKRIKSTPDHRYWVVNRGYTEISSVTENEELFRIENTLPNMWKDNSRLQRSLQKLHRKISKLNCEDTLLKMWKTCFKFIVRIKKEYDRRELERKILFSEMSMSSKQREEVWNNWTSLSNLWKNRSVFGQSVLLSKMPRNCFERKIGEEEVRTIKAMSSLWEYVSANRLTKNLLFSGLCQQSSFFEDDGSWKFTLQRWNKLQQRVRRYETCNFEERQLLLSELWEEIKNISLQVFGWNNQRENEFNNSSFGHKSEEQFRKEFDNIMCNLSYYITQSERLVRKIEGTGKTKFYDIQVSGNHNFFAEGILVHNCIICDDLISADNAKKDAQIMRNALTFFRGTVPTRLNNKTTGVIWHIQQRLGNGDVSGMIAEDKGLSKIYSHTEIQAIASYDQTFVFPCSGRVKEIKKGDLLWTERFGDYTNLQMEVGEADFETQYNQNPSASNLNIVKPDYIHWAEDDEVEEFKLTAEFHYASHDCPVKGEGTSDFHGYGEGYSRGNELLITDAFEEHMGYIEEKELMQNLSQVDPAMIQIVEDKANGAALLQDLKFDIPGLDDFKPGTRSKAQRLELAALYMKNGAVRFARTERTEYLVKQLLKFPLVIHDDIVDAFSQMVIYHFTQKHMGVYTGAFSRENIIENREVYEPYHFYDYIATINGDTIKVIAVDVDNTADVYTVEEEYIFRGIESFEKFVNERVPAGSQIMDASVNNILSALVTDVYSMTKFIEQDRDASIGILKAGFFKKRILVRKDCKQTINDIAKLRVTPQSRDAGQDKVDTLDEGMAGCLRAYITYSKGYSQLWF